MDVDNMWFQQEGATSHTANATIEILYKRFEDIVISRMGNVNRPPKSRFDLLHFFLWDFLKSHLYVNNSQSTDAFKVDIIPFLTNWTSRIYATVGSRGEHLNDVIFRT